MLVYQGVTAILFWAIFFGSESLVFFFLLKNHGHSPGGFTAGRQLGRCIPMIGRRRVDLNSAQAPIGNFEGSSISSLRPRRGGAGGGWPLPSSSTSGGGGSSSTAFSGRGQPSSPPKHHGNGCGPGGRPAGVLPRSWVPLCWPRQSGGMGQHHHNARPYRCPPCWDTWWWGACRMAPGQRAPAVRSVRAERLHTLWHPP